MTGKTARNQHFFDRPLSYFAGTSNFSVPIGLPLRKRNNHGITSVFSNPRTCPYAKFIDGFDDFANSKIHNDEFSLTLGTA